MRTKLLALAILILLLGIPFFFYTSYIKGSEATLSIVGQGDYTVYLQGTFGYSFLPLADKFLDIEKNCSDVCVIAPIPKADYKVTITQTGSLNFESDIVVDNGSNLRLEYLPQRALKESTPFAFPALPDSTETYTYLTHLKNDTFVVENKIEPRSVGFLVGNTYRLVREINPDILISTDISGNFLILTKEENVTIISKDFSNETELPNNLRDVLSVDHVGNTWKIQSTYDVYESNGNEWQKNIRFNDFLDISRTQRIGYIRGDDAEKLSLGNLPSGQGVLIFLDRSTGESYVIQSGVTITSLIQTENGPATIDNEKNITLIDIE